MHDASVWKGWTVSRPPYCQVYAAVNFICSFDVARLWRRVRHHHWKTNKCLALGVRGKVAGLETKTLLKTHLHITLWRFLGKSTFKGKSIFKEIFLRYCVKCFGKLYEEDLAPVLLDEGFWWCRLLVENPFEDYYVGLHLQNDLCYDYCWDCFEMMVGKIELRDCYEMMVESWFGEMAFMSLLWNDGESVGGCRVMQWYEDGQALP